MISSIDANGVQTNYTYDNMGHRLTQTNPFPQGGTPGPSTTYQYDQMGRLTLTTLPDGNTTNIAYSGRNIVTATDQVNRTIKREKDGLGRLIKVTEQDTLSGNVTQETTYSYDIRDHLIATNQANQTRAFKYDADDHLLFERVPEMTATINDGNGNYWTSKYTYTDFGAIATKTDARGVIIAFGYDSLHRLISITYNTGSAPDVAPTNNVTYNYDTSQTSATNGLLLSITMTGPLAKYAETYNYDSLNRVSSKTWTRDGQSYAINYQYNTANEMTQMVYPSSVRTLNIGRDSVGRAASISDQYRSYLSGITYDGIGRVTGLGLGNVATENYGYDANRMQMTSQKATAAGGPSNGLMNLTYGYQATTGQSGAGTTAGNSGQLMSISGTINGTTESATYSYDDLGRLVTSDQSTNGSSAQRRFAYDLWGNRTGVWDSTSGGSQIQSINLAQSGLAPTNRIASVTYGQSNYSYAYDANGNLISDGVHTYQYDAENRIESVDYGASGAYAYDHKNRRIKKVVGSTSTHYVWEGDQVIAEHNAATGAAIYNYVYSGNRLLARMGSGVINWFLSDRLSERLVLDASGNVVGRMSHLPFGEDFGESGIQEKHHLTSYERDTEVGTDYALNRQYLEGLGRFESCDPLEQTTVPESSQSWNRYSYVVDNPVDHADPDGRESCNVTVRDGGARVVGAYADSKYGRRTGVVNDFLAAGNYVYLFEAIISTYGQTEPLTYWYATAATEFSLIYKHKKNGSPVINQDSAVFPDYFDSGGEVQWYQVRFDHFSYTDFQTYLYVPLVVPAKPSGVENPNRYKLVACIRNIASACALASDGVNGLRFYRLLAN